MDVAGLLGREREVAALTSILDQAVAGHGSAVLLRGEAGIGKTRLLAEAQRLAAERGLQTLTCSGVRTEADLPFAGLHQLLRPALAFLPGIPGGQADLLRAALGLDDSLVADLYRVALATLELLAAVAAKAPLLVVADDVHWLDRPSADVLAFVCRRISVEPIAIMMSARDGNGDPFEAAGLPSLAVGALDAESAGALLSQVAPDLAGGTRVRLLDDAAGNPLALIELPAAVQSAGPLPGHLPVGDLLRRSFTARVAELPRSARLLLRAAAADGGCSVAELCEVASAVSGLTVTEADIQPAIDARLVRLDGDRVVFSHPLIASAIYQSMTVGDRQRIHRALAQVIPAGNDRRVWHQAAALLGPDDAVAAELEALADRASRRGAVTVSIAALDRAAGLATSKARQAELMLRSAELAVELGRGQLALDLLARADIGQVEPFGHARSLIISEAVRPAVGPGLSGAGPSVAELVAAARDTQAAGDTDLAASVLWTAASRCWWTSAGRPDRLAVVDAAQALNLPATDPRRIAILSYTVTHEQRPQLRRDLLEASPGRDDLASLRYMASAAENLGDHALATGLFAAAARQARRQGRLGVIARLQALQAWASLWSAGLDTAEILSSETERLGSELSQPMWHGAAVLELELVAALRGDYAPAKVRLLAALESEEIRDVRLYHAMALYGLSVAALGVGRYQDAYALLRRIADPADPVSHYGACQWLVGDLAEAAASTGRAVQDAPLIANLAADLRGHPTPAVRYSVLYADAMLASDEAALARFEAALAADPGGSGLAEARLQLAYGSWLRRHRRMREARAALARAHDIFASLGTEGFAYRATREQHAAGAARQASPGGGLPRLTPQELQIAQLAAQGLSNRQIGEQLFLSHRTVGSHLYHLFPKLGITTRAQLPDALNAARPDKLPAAPGAGIARSV